MKRWIKRLVLKKHLSIFQEPTSGLDSTTAYNLVCQLKSFASRYNKMVLVTIHQPSSQIYHIFDTLLLLSHGQVRTLGIHVCSEIRNNVFDLHHCVVLFFWSFGIMDCIYLHLKIEFRSSTSNGSSVFYFHWWTASIKPMLLFSLCKICFRRTFHFLRFINENCCAFYQYLLNITLYQIIY